MARVIETNRDRLRVANTFVKGANVACIQKVGDRDVNHHVRQNEVAKAQTVEGRQAKSVRVHNQRSTCAKQ